MKGFKLDSSGDVIIQSNDIAMIYDNELKAQTVRTILGTNKGEWPLNTNEGIDFGSVLGKGATEDMALTQVQSGLKQVDRNLYVDTFNYSEDRITRSVKMTFTARDDKNNVITDTQTWS